jgi:hypothetical protein
MMTPTLLKLVPPPSRDQDISKGATEDEKPSTTTNAPGLNDQGLPNDPKAIAEDAVGARADKTVG